MSNFGIEIFLARLRHCLFCVCAEGTAQFVNFVMNSPLTVLAGNREQLSFFNGAINEKRLFLIY